MQASLKNIISFFILTTFNGLVWGQDFSKNFFLGKDELVDKVIQNDEYRFQYLITYLRDDSLVKTEGEISGNYFYPASSIKLPIAILVFEKMNELGIQLDDRLVIESEIMCGNTAYIRNSQKNELTFRKMLQQLIVVSDNDHYNAFYHFLSPHYINEKLSEKGYKDIKIYRAFTGCTKEENLITNGWRVLRSDSVVRSGEKMVFPLEAFEANYTYDENKLIGDKHEKDNSILKGPYDFNYNIEVPLDQLHLITLDLYKKSSNWSLNPTQQELLLTWMKEFPKECTSLVYDKRSRLDDHVYKYLFSDIENERAFSKIGLSYGFTTETAIFKCGIKTIVITSSIYTNANKIVNDGDYEYEAIARPFLCRFGNLVLEQVGECNK